MTLGGRSSFRLHKRRSNGHKSSKHQVGVVSENTDYDDFEFKYSTRCDFLIYAHEKTMFRF